MASDSVGVRDIRAPRPAETSRSRAWPRASCDFEKLAVRPSAAAISSCVSPSTSWSHSTARVAGASRPNARSRSIVSPSTGSTCRPIDVRRASSSSFASASRDHASRARCQGERRCIRHRRTRIWRTQAPNGASPRKWGDSRRPASGSPGTDPRRRPDPRSADGPGKRPGRKAGDTAIPGPLPRLPRPGAAARGQLRCPSVFPRELRCTRPQKGRSA